MKQLLAQHIGKTIRNTRLKKGITQTELAERLNTQQPSIARLESGKILPNLSFLTDVCEELEIDVMIDFSGYVKNANMR